MFCRLVFCFLSCLDRHVPGLPSSSFVGGDGADALDGDVVEAHAGMKGEGGDNGGLGGGVEAVDSVSSVVITRAFCIKAYMELSS